MIKSKFKSFNEQWDQQTLMKYISITIGALALVIGINVFIVPLNLYNGGTIGISQIIRSVLSIYFNIKFNFDIAGTINLFINIPLLILAYRGVSQKFFYRTIYALIVQTIFFTFIRISEPIIPDALTACLIGGIISGYGVGMILSAGGSSGGFDILGMYFVKRKRGSVGQLSTMLNACIYVICAILFEIPTAIYSIIYSVIFSIIVDRVHFQNVKVSVLIFTKMDYLQDRIMFDLNRGCTCWKGIGGYTDAETNIIMTVISKYEINMLRRYILELDPNAFIVAQEGLQVIGNYEIHL